MTASLTGIPVRPAPGLPLFLPPPCRRSRRNPSPPGLTERRDGDRELWALAVGAPPPRDPHTQGRGGDGISGSVPSRACWGTWATRERPGPFPPLPRSVPGSLGQAARGSARAGAGAVWAPRRGPSFSPESWRQHAKQTPLSGPASRSRTTWALRTLVRGQSPCTTEHFRCPQTTLGGGALVPVFV